MGKKIILFTLFMVILAAPFLGNTVKAQQLCDTTIILLNQDPFPVIPGEYVELVFQVAGVVNIECGLVVFELLEEFPIIFDPDDDTMRTILSGTFSESGFETGWMVPYRVRIHEDALEGNNSIDIKYTFSGLDGFVTRTFDIKIEDVRTEFTIAISDYDQTDNTLTFEIQNIGENDAEALTVLIPPQPNIEVKGNQQNIIGSLDAFEDTTFNFEALPQPGDINLQIRYIDEIGELRIINKLVTFNPNFYIGRNSDGGGTSRTTYIFVIVAILIIVYFIWKYYSNKKRKEKLKL